MPRLRDSCSLEFKTDCSSTDEEMVFSDRSVRVRHDRLAQGMLMIRAAGERANGEEDTSQVDAFAMGDEFRGMQ